MGSNWCRNSCMLPARQGCDVCFYVLGCGHAWSEEQMGRCLYGCPRRPAGTEAEWKVAINFFYNSTLSPFLCVSLFVSLCLCLFILTFLSLVLCQALYICICIPSPPALCLSFSAYILSVICAFVSIGSSRGNISVHLIDWSLHIAPSDQASDDRNHYIHMYTNHRYIIIPVGPIVGLCRP